MKKTFLAIVLIICISLGIVVDGKSYVVKADDFLENGVYVMVSVQDSSYCGDMDNFGTSNGTKLQLWKNKTGNASDLGNQFFVFHRESDGSYTIRLYYTDNMYLHVMCDAVATYVHGWSGTGINARWRLYRVPATDDEWYIQSCSSGSVLDNCEGKVANGNPLIVYPFNGGINQRFRLVKVNLNSTPVGALETAEIQNGKLHVKGFCFDRDNTAEPLTVAVSVGSNWYKFTANKQRSDINNKYIVGAYHGFEEWLTVDASGDQEVLVYGVDYGSSMGYLLANGSKTVKFPDNSEHYYYVVNCKSGLNVRSGAGTNYSKIGALAKNTTVEVLSINNNWAKIKYNNGSSIGYVCADYLSYSYKTKDGGTALNSATKYYTYKDVEYIAVKNLSSAMGQKQKPRQCTKTSADICVSLAKGSIYTGSGWASGGATWRDSSGKSILYKGMPNASAQEKLNTTAKLLKDYGASVILRLGSDTGHSIVAVGLKSSAQDGNIKASDILIIDPADGNIKNLQELSSSSYWYGGIKDNNGWSILYSIEYPAISGFSVK